MNKRNILKILLIASLCVVPLAIIIMANLNYNVYNPSQNNWVFLILEIIPLISTLFGIIYRKDNGIVNIIIGIMISFYFIMFGSSWITDNTKVEYKEIYKYKDILEIELPREGNAYLLKNVTDAYIENEYNILDIDYDEKYSKKLINNIKNNNNFIISKELDKKLIKYISVSQRTTSDNKLLVYDEDILDYESYYMIYNKTLDIYNEPIKKAGKYELYVIRYLPESRHLSICYYTYLKKDKK